MISLKWVLMAQLSLQSIKELISGGKSELKQNISFNSSVVSFNPETVHNLSFILCTKMKNKMGNTAQKHLELLHIAFS